MSGIVWARYPCRRPPYTSPFHYGDVSVVFWCGVVSGLETDASRALGPK